MSVGRGSAPSMQQLSSVMKPGADNDDSRCIRRLPDSGCLAHKITLPEDKGLHGVREARLFI